MYNGVLSTETCFRAYFFTFRVNCSHDRAIVTFNFYCVSHLGTFSHIDIFTLTLGGSTNAL